jgi:hypothetical protein
VFPIAAFERRQCAVSVFLFPSVVAQIKLAEMTVQMPMQMPLSDVMVHPI